MVMWDCWLQWGQQSKGYDEDGEERERRERGEMRDRKGKGGQEKR
jgi:hypothetical protein